VLGALPFLFWLPTFLSQPNPYFLRAAWNPANPLFVPPPNALDKLGFFAWTVVRSLPLWPESLAIVLGLFLIVALVTLIPSRRINPDAIAMGLIYAIALALVSAAGRLNVRYIVPFEGLLCVFLAWVVAAWFEAITRKYPAQWARWGAAITAVLCVLMVSENVIFALHTARMPKSGIRTFVGLKPLDPATLYVMVPDAITATFAFYARGPQVAYAAFPQSDHPEIFRYGSEAGLYGPRTVRDGLVRLSRQARAYEYLDLIVDDTADLPGRRFLDSMRARYRLVSRAYYPGRLESVTVYRFWVRARDFSRS
jgi:hypothetical protein